MDFLLELLGVGVGKAVDDFVGDEGVGEAEEEEVEGEDSDEDDGTCFLDHK